MKRLFFPMIVALSACGSPPASQGPDKVDIPVRDTSKQIKGGAPKVTREPPPSALASKPAPFPIAQRKKLDNGIDIAAVEAHALPIVQIRVTVRAGSGYAQAGAAGITATMLKDGGTRSMSSAQLLNRVETLGANMMVDTDFDHIVLGIAVTKSHVDEALAILAEMVQSPRFDEGELKKLKTRMSDEADDNARQSGEWMAMRVMFRELFATQSPYATFDVLPSEIAKVTGATIRDFHKRFFVPKSTSVVIVGDMDTQTAQKAVETHFGKWKGADPPKVDFPAAIAPAKRRVFIANRPKSVQSDVFIAGLVPPRNSADWADIRVANHVLGGGVASRLFGDVREQRSLAYRTSAQIMELGHGDQPLFAYAGTESKKTALAVQGVLDNMEKIVGASPVTDTEAATSRRYLSDIFAVRMETVGSIADLIVTQDTLGLGDGYWDKYRDAVRAIDAGKASAAAKKLYHADKALIVVAGDADEIGPELAKFGEVVVVDPEKEFTTVKTIPATP